MADKKFYWLKLQDDFFNSKRIKKLRKLAGGDTYTIIYLKMQLVAMKKGGYLEYTGIEKTFAEELALELDEEPENVCVTVNYLLSCGLLEVSNNKDYFVPYAVMNTGSESSSAKRVREHRERKALQCNADVTDVKQLCNTEKEIEIEKREREDEEIREDSELTAAEPPAPPRPHIPYESIKTLYNDICTAFPKCTALSEARKKAIKARFAGGYTVDHFRTLFEKAQASSFLRGANGRNWMANFDWLIKDSSMAKVLGGNYDDHPQRQNPTKNSGSPTSGFDTTNPFLQFTGNGGGR